MTGETGNGETSSPAKGDANEAVGAELEFEHPTTVSVDEPVALTIDGVPSETVDVRVSLTDGSDRGWESTATYDTADETLDLGSTTSTDGDVTGGVTELVQRATPVEGSGPYETGRDACDELTVRVEHDGETLGSTTIERTFGDRDVTSEAVDGESFVGRLYEPPGSEPAPAVVVLHGSSGEPVDGTAQLLASRGFVALALQYFDWQGRRDNLPAELVAVPLESVENAIESLRERNGVRGPDVGLFGTSKGGELALLAGSRLESVGSVVSVNGSGVVWAGISRREFPPGPSWTSDGEPISHVPYTDDHSVWDVEPPMEMEPGYSQSLEDADDETVAEATIAVESIAGPVLLVSGGADRMWDSVRLHDLAAERLDRHGCDYEHLTYPDAGHAITTPYLPTADRERTAQFVMGGSADGYAEADSDHWPHVLKTFETLRT
ncbi:acyl-CoA thioester hydrolase/BAAT C-terminal domain-containing protein [Natrinema longum]|uniref:Dienelactone hydrolase family protein n=1 Tax=Natrinema longum TaxID=370324 RepID=A0A8A2U6L7_9EURY|nr:acyl-CoA thioester hydrolase/BAAT C-terminal domain-containing protein [Natrinema longum]MBZ6494204.1 dienelactone hydrolase family protein [Natrinema longum]QSW84469.1 dienelactone hydrolase family protein [Natrinema longum]